MRYLFADNFRGFAEACIPIQDVNFLVGENSTGKTSVLGLLKLFTDPNFLIRPEFGDDHVDFGHFREMVSAHSADRTYFRVGQISSLAGSVLGWLCTYKEAEGAPRLTRFTYCGGTHKLSMSFQRNQIFFRLDSAFAGQSIDPVEEITQWAAEHSIAPEGFELLDTGGIPGGIRIPIILALSLANAKANTVEAAPKKTKDRDAVLEFPFGASTDSAWVAPIRTKPLRTYDGLSKVSSLEGEHTPYLIRKLLRSKKDALEFTRFIRRVGKSSGLFQNGL